MRNVAKVTKTLATAPATASRLLKEPAPPEQWLFPSRIRHETDDLRGGATVWEKIRQRCGIQKPITHRTRCVTPSRSRWQPRSDGFSSAYRQTHAGPLSRGQLLMMSAVRNRQGEGGEKRFTLSWYALAVYGFPKRKARPQN